MNKYTISDLRKAFGEALKLNSLCMGHPDGNPRLPEEEDGLLRKDISDTRWKVRDILDSLEQASKDEDE